MSAMFVDTWSEDTDDFENRFESWEHYVVWQVNERKTLKLRYTPCKTQPANATAPMS